MSDVAPPEETSATREEARAIAFVEELIGGRVVKIKRLSRWRPAWFLDVDRDGTLLQLHLRGDRRSDVLPFPSLQREADILRVLEAGGVPVPHVYGMCPDPLAIVMDTVPGVRAQTGPPEQQQVIAEEYMGLLARMHALDTADFVGIGLDLPTTPEDIGLGMLDFITAPKCRRNRSSSLRSHGPVAASRRIVRAHALSTGTPASSFTRAGALLRSMTSRRASLVTR
jgi:hypothetical protein